MTLCVAAPCIDEKDNRCIVVASDWKQELGEYTGAEIQNKLYWLWEGAWPVLIAGTASDALDLIATFRRSFNRKGITEDNARDRIMEALLEYKRKFTEDYVQAATNLPFSHFKDNQDKIAPDTWKEVWRNVGKIKADCVMIMCSFVAGVPLMFQVSGKFSDLPEEKLVLQEENFLTIGSGSVIANSMLCFRAQNEDLPVFQTVYNVFEAMRFARQASAPGVGKSHAFSVLRPASNGRIIRRRLKNKGLDFFKEQYEHFGPQNLPGTMKVPKGIWERY
jgi:ATP-dependent protease HslVU (ClpYQ) peptidase subunit